MKTEHNGIEIVYEEATNRWAFELRGRSRTAESLAKAKEIIDKPVSEKTKAAEFKRVTAWFSRWDSTWVQVEVTSVAHGQNWSNRAEVWIKDGTERSKESSAYVYPVGPENDCAVKNILKAQEQIDRLKETQESWKKKMKCLEVQKEEPAE